MNPRKLRLRFLSDRISVLAAAAVALCLFLLLAYGAAVIRGLPAWPLLIAVPLLVLLLMAYTLLIIRPYRRLEHMTSLFLSGYSLSGIESADGLHLTPGSERLLDSLREAYNAPSLLKLSKRQAQYRALQNQINPHFLYNTLESIRSEALIAGLQSVAGMTEALAVFFRYTISKVENLVSVEEELQNCETYVRIQQYRFGDRLRFQIESDDEDRAEILRCRLPKLTLQPILENSIIHGTESKVGTGNLAVRLNRSESRLLIEVSDDGVGMDEGTLARLNERLSRSGRAFQEDGGERSGGVALVNVNNRIHLLFGEEYGLTVYSLPGLGTDVRISLPLITSESGLLETEER